MTWDSGTSQDVRYHTFSLQTQSEFTENSDIANWGDWYFATADNDTVRTVRYPPQRSTRKELMPIYRSPGRPGPTLIYAGSLLGNKD